MEPADLNSPSPDDARLDAWLRDSSALPPLPDNGFSRRVVAALPRQDRRRSLSTAAYLIGGAAGLAFAAWQGAFSSGWTAAEAAGGAGLDLWQMLTDPMLFLAVVIATASALFALNSESLRRWF